jgi:hypothetical protein
VLASGLDFRLRACRFHFHAVDSVFFPPAKAGNVLRGALGKIGDVPEGQRPSGLADPPRAFVLRAAHLDGRRFAPGEAFTFQANVFDVDSALVSTLQDACAAWALSGLGPRRGRVELTGCDAEPVSIDLQSGPPAVKCTLRFATPTELKGNLSREDIPFGVLFARVRDRMSALCSIYGDGAPELDFRALGERAAEVKTTHRDLQYQAVERRSSRTGAVHGIGGITGLVTYEGELTEFLPWLRAAWWTGVGRHTSWGNGVVEVMHVE